ncbi:uncharacterized protein DUF4476 [Sediminitomix flava]|uniref:Uncharacterized protein DUF4476 n=2 Tax=Sediminitomix flava TaxID=379075 RepID=A0A315Z0J8_SEDFL|nr:uncharacterized protein DUF4476 [Sediminitomix flava]
MTVLFLTVLTNVFGQQKKYNLPKAITAPDASFTFQKVSGSSSSYSVNFKAQNTGDGVLLLDRSKTKLAQNEGEVYPTSQITMLKAGESKVIYNQFRIKAPVQKNADYFDFILDGVQYAKAAKSSITAEKLVLAEKATQTAGEFAVKVMEYNVYSDRIYASVKCTFNGNGKQLGKIDLTGITVNGGTPKIVKKGDVLQAGKSYTFSINITPNGEETSIEWGNAFQVMNLVDVKIAPIKVTSTTYKETEEAAKKEEVKATEEKKDVAKDCALSYADFSALKKDIETEINAGGDAIGMANEFLMEKKCINVDQVLEYLSVFNLDGQRLAFAKMAYQYTSDKPKFHLVVTKLAYTKNKQALEEFLEVQ